MLAEFALLYPEIEIDLNLSYGITSIARLETDVSIRHTRTVEDDVVGRKLFPLGHRHLRGVPSIWTACCPTPGRKGRG